MSDTVKVLREWQERHRFAEPFVIPHYEDFARMVEGMENDADTIEDLLAENERLRTLLVEALDAIDYTTDELSLWFEAANLLEEAGFDMGETEHAISNGIGAAKKIRAALTDPAGP